LAVSDQLTEQDLGIAAAQGLKSINNNRPDGEAEDQPPSRDPAAAAERLGLACRHVPWCPARSHTRTPNGRTLAEAALRDVLKGHHPIGPAPR
jgi:uncharacterized protein (TIGR01244 family)